MDYTNNLARVLNPSKLILNAQRNHNRSAMTCTINAYTQGQLNLCYDLNKSQTLRKLQIKFLNCSQTIVQAMQCLSACSNSCQ